MLSPGTGAFTVLISLRGTNGSGKSTVVRNLFSKYKPTPIYGVLGPRDPTAYMLLDKRWGTPLYVLGPYRTGTGGCDRIQPYDLIPELIAKYAGLGHVLFEGIIITSTYGQVGELMEKFKKKSVFLFLDTSLEECLRRIEKRRGGKPRDERLIKNVTDKFNTMWRIRDRIVQDNIMRVEVVNSDVAHEKIIGLLKDGKAA